MKKRLLVVLMAVVATLCLCFGLAACSSCNGGSTPEHVHTYDQQVATSEFLKSEADCTEKAVYYYSCTCGEKDTATFEYGEAMGHTLVHHDKVAASCEKTGNIEYWDCSSCQKYFSDESGTNEIDVITSDALGHAWSEKTVTSATCTTEGKVDYICTRCDATNSNIINALGHSYTNYVTTDATCTSDSYKTAKCDRCEETNTITNEGTALGHNYGADGKCTRCFTINPNLKVTSLEISNDSFLLEAGKATQVKFAVYPSDAIYEKATYRIHQNNTCDATLTETGLLTCGKVGSVTIAVTIDDEITARATFYVPQMITTAEEFFNIRNDLGGVYMLANDIDLSGYANWTPIGNATKSASGNYDYTNAFSGKFDGGGHTVSRLNINLSDLSCSSLLTVGLFGSLSRDGQVSNVVLRDVEVTGTSNTTDYVGMLVGFNPGSVNDCNVNGTMTVSGATYIGGVIGENIGSAENISSSVAITITGSKNYLVGGITGRTTGGQLSDVSVLGSINVTSSSSVYVGGVAGNLVDKLTTASADVDITVKTTSSSSSYNYVGIIAGASSQSLSDITVDGSLTINSYGNAYAGGIVGYSDAGISNCVNDAVISFTATNSTSSYVGGIIGCTTKDIDGCTNNGTVSATQFNGGYIGGIAGASGAVSKCENNADVYAKSTSKSVYCGGVVGNAKSVVSSNNNAKVNAILYADSINYAGGVVGNSEGEISNCTNNEKGILVISYSSSSSSYSSKQYFGGVVGYGKSIVSDSTNYANISAISNGVVYCGGVLGYANGNVTKINNYGYSLTITSVSTNSNYSNFVGGVAGYINGTLTTAYNTATVTVTKGYIAVGGVAGYVNSSTTSANSTANITVNNIVYGQNAVTYVGGVIGNTPSSVTSSFATNSNIEVSSKNKVYVGGVVGNCGGTITECYAYPNITVANSCLTYIGGVSGYVKKIVKSYSMSNVIGNTAGSYDLYAGGLSGFISTGVEESYATGDVSGTASSKVYMAGLVGYVGNDATVTNCYASNGYIKTNSSSLSSSLTILIYNGGLVGYNDGTISYCYAVNYGYSISYGSSNNHSHYMGGLVAYNKGTISSSYVLDATDKLARMGLEVNRDVVGSGTAESFYAGGFVGYNQGTVSNCYSDATVNTTVSGAYTGGFVGFNNATIKNSIAYGEVNSGITGDTTGGFAGGGTSGYTSCFFSKDSTLQTTSVGSTTQSGITASTKVNLRTAATFSGFSSTYWNIVDGSYPTLIFGSVWESRSDGFNKYYMLLNVPNEENQYQFPHSNRMTIRFEHNGEEAADAIIADKGDIVILPTLKDYEADGKKYMFIGWCTDSECLNLIESNLVTLGESKTYYAYYCQAVEKPKATQYIFTGDTISVAEVYISNEAYTVNGTLEGVNAGEYKITLKLSHGYCWSDSSMADLEIAWEISKRVLDIPNIYNSGEYVFYSGENRDLSSEFGNEFLVTTGDISIDKLDSDKHTIKFSLVDIQNCVWSDSTVSDKSFDYFVVSGVCGADNANIAYRLEDGVLTLIGKGDMASYSSGHTPWYSERNEIKEIIITNGVTSIGSYAFNGCTSLTSIIIIESITSIESYAFNGCNSLTNIYYGRDEEGWLSILGLSNLMSYGSSSKSLYFNNVLVTSITIPDGVTSIDDFVFSGCTSLTSITIPDSVTSIGNSAFSGCTCEIKWGDNPTITKIGDRAFYGYKGTSITIPDSVTSIGNSAFSGCTCEIKWGDNPTITKIGDRAFYGYKGTRITISDSVTSIGNSAFSGCTCEIKWGDNPTITKIGDYAFYSYQGTSIAIPNSVTSIGASAFYNCTSLTRITISDSVMSIEMEAFKNCTLLESVMIGNGVTSIGGSAFRNCNSLTSITIPDGVKSIGYGAFTDCYKLIEVYNLSSLTITAGSSSNGYVAYYAKNVYTANEGSSKLTMTEDGYIFYDDTENNNGYYLMGYNGTEIAITLPDNFKGNDYSIYQNAFRGCTSLESVTIGNGVTSIGSYAFYDCTSLTGITIPDGVTSIGYGAFYNCYRLIEVYNLSSLTITAGSSSNGYVAYYAKNVYTANEGASKFTMSEDGYIFYDDTANNNGYYLMGYNGTETVITLPDNFKENNYSIYQNAFRGCTSLTSITIPDSVTSIGNSAFSGCTCEIKWGDNPTITKIGDRAFYGYKGTSITIPDSVTSIGNSAFSGCTCEIKWGDNPTITKIGDYAFYSYQGTSIAIPNSVTSIDDYVFSGCTSLTSITIPDGVTSIGDSAFYGCASLTNVTIPDSVTSIGGSAFGYCTSLTSITIPDGVTSIEYGAFQNCTSLTGIAIPNSVTSIGSSAFYNCKSLASITIPDSVTGLPSGLFCGCSSLESITLPFVGGSVKSSSDTYQYPFGYIFGTSSYTGGMLVTQYYYGSSTSSRTSTTYYIPSTLHSVTITGGNILYGAFYDCSKLERVTIGSGLTSIGNSAFLGCISLTDIYYSGDVEGWLSITGLSNLMCCGNSGKNLYFNNVLVTSITIPDGLTSIGEAAFSYCTSLMSIKIPDGVTSIGESAFHSCTSLTSITISNSVTSIGSGAFSNCTSLTSITIPDSVTSIGSAVFMDCTSLESVTIPNAVTTIGYGTFQNCTSLTSITIPSSVTSIGYSAFQNCISLTSVIFNGTLEQWNTITKGSYWNTGTGDYTLTCTNGKISK